MPAATSSTDDSKEDGQWVEWWSVKPRQSAPPRQTGMAPGSHGRFVMNEDLMQLGELRVGRGTEVGGQLEIPKVQPIVSFVLLIVNLSCYGTYLNIYALQGPDAAEEFLSALLLAPQLLLLHDLPQQLVHALGSCIMAPGPAELFVALWALALVAPRAESSLGYSTFAAIFALSGMTGGVVQMLAMSGDVPAVVAAAAAGSSEYGACGAAAATMGILGSLVVHHLRNRDVEAQAAAGVSAQDQQRTANDNSSTALSSSSSSSSSSSTSASGPTRQQRSQQQLLIQGICVAAASLGLAGMQHISGDVGDPSGAGNVWREMAHGVGVPAQLAGFVTGAVLAWGMGPRYAIQREVQIPEGSMHIPDDAEELCVVMDRTTSVQRVLAAVGYSLALAAAAGLGAAHVSGLMW